MNLSNAISVNKELQHIENARSILISESESLKILADSLGEDFNRAISLIINLRGRIITCGMGKSGHVARKIAATLASTGTPSLFLHPGEASHGDLGMVTEQDGLLILSNSGETKELRDVIEYSRRFNIPMIAMVRRKTSALVDAADVALILPDEPEALPADAPSTSTTMMMALGDAIAGSLMIQRGFSAEDFHSFHPGGKLGAKFIKVAELMHTGESLPIVPETMPMSEVIPVMTAKSLGIAVVVSDSGILRGIITDGDLRRNMQHSLLQMPAIGVINGKFPLTIHSNSLALEALGIMNRMKITTLVVCENIESAQQKPIGVIHIHDCLRAGVA
jgi:arabinose-5-phosphate isomerase